MERKTTFTYRIMWQKVIGWVKKGIRLLPFLLVGEFLPVVSLTGVGLAAGIGAMVILTLWGNALFALKYVWPSLILSGGIPEIVVLKYISDTAQTVMAFIIVAVMKRPEV